MTPTAAAFVHAPVAPDTVTAGEVRSSRTDPGAPADAGVQAEVLPAVSVARNATSVVPSRVTVVEVPAVVAPQVEPRSFEVRYWVPATPDAPSDDVERDGAGGGG